MSKTLADKKVNHLIKSVNRDLYNDVFKDRFWVRQYQKAKVDGISYYLFELCDRLQPERNEVIRGWFNEYEVMSYKFWDALNNFIIYSDFWKLYWAKKEKENIQ